MADRTDVLIWAAGPGAVPPQLTDALESQGIVAHIHLGSEAPTDPALVVVRWCDSFASKDFAAAIDMLTSGTAKGVVVVADGMPALMPDALRPGLLLIDGTTSPRSLATAVATSLVAARELASQDEERARLSDVADAQENLVAIASHDLRTPVSTLRLVHDLFRSGLSAATLPRSSNKIDIDELLDIFERNLDKMEAFINDILEASRLYRGRVEVRFDAVSLNAVIDDTIAGMFPIAMRKDIALDFAKGSELPAIRGETTRVSQVVANLLGNALKYTPSGGTVSVYSRGCDGGAELEVADSGPGISDADRDKVFRRFLCGSARATGGEPSTGLGLFICREIVDLYGGKIWFESKAGSGSTFFVFWPGRSRGANPGPGRRGSDQAEGATMRLSVERHGNVDVLTPCGSIHSGDDADFGQALVQLRQAERFYLVLNATRLDYINSRAIGHLVQFSRDARLAGGTVALVRPGPSVEKILKAVGLLSLIPTYNTVEQAVAACAPDA